MKSALGVAGSLNMDLSLREIPKIPVRKPLASYLAERNSGKLIAVRNMRVSSENNNGNGFLLTPPSPHENEKSIVTGKKLDQLLEETSNSFHRLFDLLGSPVILDN